MSALKQKQKEREKKAATVHPAVRSLAGRVRAHQADDTVSAETSPKQAQLEVLQPSIQCTSVQKSQMLKFRAFPERESCH